MTYPYPELLPLLEIKCSPAEHKRVLARLKLEAIGTRVDVLTAERQHYLNSWEEGT